MYYLEKKKKTSILYQCVWPGGAAQLEVRQDQFEKKIVSCLEEHGRHFTFWASSRWSYSNHYCEPQDRVYAALSADYPTLVNKIHGILQPNLLRTHSRLTKEQLLEQQKEYPSIYPRYCTIRLWIVQILNWSGLMFVFFKRVNRKWVFSPWSMKNNTVILAMLS